MKTHKHFLIDLKFLSWFSRIRNKNCSSCAGRQLLLKAVNRVWTELMHSKRQMLEDIFKVSLPCNDRGHVDISTARPALEEPALKSWQNHLGE